MAKKHLPIQFFEKRKDYDDRSTEGGGNSAPPSWVLTGDALTAKSSALTSSVGDVITVFRERQSQEKKLPLVVCTTLEEKAIAKSHRSEITGLYIDENGSNVLGFAGNRCLLTMVSSESTLETIDRALSDTETRAKLISSIVDIEPFYPAVDKFDASIRYYKVRLINYNNYDLNCATKIVFEQQCAAAGIAIEQKTKFTPDMTVYRVCIDSMEQLNLLEDFEGIYTVEKMLPISVTLDTLTSPTTIVAKAPIEGIEYPVVGILDTGIADNPYLSAWKTADSFTSYPDQYKDPSHGSFVSGIIEYGDELNGLSTTMLPGVHLFDAAVYPDSSKQTIYAIDLSEMTTSNRQRYLRGDRKWYLKIEGLYRDFIEQDARARNYQLSQEYCLLLTIRDPNGKAPVYDEVAQQLDYKNFLHHNIQLRNVVTIDGTL